MIRRLHTLIARIQRLFAPKHKGADRSRLTAMYLDQTNRPSGAGMRGATNQGRQDGKFAQKRGRAD
jgi:hypothetical protein